MGKQRDIRPYVVHQALQELGWDASAQAIAHKVKLLEIGFPAKDEFSVLLGWLGQCKVVHKLDQSVPPATDLYRIPDLLAVFDYRGRSVPVLIEVKACEDNTISWKPDYHSALRNYADTLNLPLLVAWKHLTFWVLFDARHFTKATTNFNIQFADAMKQTLMSVLAGDFSYSFAVGSGIHINMRKLADTDEGFEAIFEECYVSNGAGERLTEDPGVMPLFLCVDNDCDVVENDSHILESFIIRTSENQFAHRALAILLSLRAGADKICWRKTLIEKRAPLFIGDGLRAVARRAQEAGFLASRFDFSPSVMPDFLQESSGPARAQRAGWARIKAVKKNA